jgi:hypothetical protein
VKIVEGWPDGVEPAMVVEAFDYHVQRFFAFAQPDTSFHAPDEGRGPRDELRFCEDVRPERIDHPPDGLTSPRRAWRLEEDEEPPIVIERPADASQLFRRRRRPEDVDVDGEDLVKPGRARVEVPNIDGLEREPP